MENNITLRDQIAIEAMKVLLNNFDNMKPEKKLLSLKFWKDVYGFVSNSRRYIAQESYDIADDMLKAREL
jgi:hypothetical protein